MSLKRSQAGGRTHFGGGADPGAKVGRQELYDELKRLAQANQFFAPVDIALAIGAGEPQVSRALLGLAAEGYLEKVDAGKYKATPFAEVPQGEFIKALARASKTDSARQRDLSEIARLKQNNDIMRSKLLAIVAERDHYLAALKKAGIDPGPAPTPPAPAGPPPSGAVSLPGQSESSVLPSGPGATAPEAAADSIDAESDEDGDGEPIV
jgi:ABC-type glycerol-3-phosphate transport system substrate-binding protein